MIVRHVPRDFFSCLFYLTITTITSVNLTLHFAPPNLLVVWPDHDESLIGFLLIDVDTLGFT